MSISVEKVTDLLRYREGGEAALEKLGQENINAIVEHFMGGRQRAVGKPLMQVIAGGNGSGKTSLEKFLDGETRPGKRARKPVLRQDAFRHDPDAVMERIPEYRADHAQHGGQKAFENWEMPARLLANSMAEHARDEKLNIVYIRSMAIQDSMDFLSTVKHGGYQVDTYAVFTNFDDISSRIRSREQETGRYLSVDVAKERTAQFSGNWHRIIAHSDNVKLYRNTHVRQGSAENGKPTDMEIFRNFRTIIAEKQAYSGIIGVRYVQQYREFTRQAEKGGTELGR